MTSFTELLAPEPGLEPAAIQDRARRALALRVQQSPLQWLAPDVSPNGMGRKLLIGVAAWNRYDLQLLDRVSNALAAGLATDTAVIVFDLDALSNPADLDRLIPGLSPLLQTPAVGYWEGGTMREAASGFFGRRLVARVLGLDESTVHPPQFAASR